MLKIAFGEDVKDRFANHFRLRRGKISNNYFNLTLLLSQFVLSRYARHKLRQLRNAG
jgi:hypothetical protein